MLLYASKNRSWELDISSLYVTTLEILSHTLCRTLPMFSPNKAKAAATHSHVQARVFSHVEKKNNKTIKELSVNQLIKNSFNWHNVWPGWQAQPHCVTGLSQDLSLINGGHRLVYSWRNSNRSASAVRLNTSSWALPGHVHLHAALTGLTQHGLQVTASSASNMSGGSAHPHP